MDHLLSFLASPNGLLLVAQLLFAAAHVLQLLGRGSTQIASTSATPDPTGDTSA